MPSSTAPPSKEDRRNQFRDYRRGLSLGAYAARSALICSRVLSCTAVATAATVHVYWPQTEEGEVDTRLLIGALRGLGKTVVLPVVTSYDPASPEMEHRRYAGPGAMTTNRWGIREPVGTERVAPDALDAVVVPALGAGRDGHRIGHGSGYYDAFLSAVDVPRLILVYEHCLVPSVPTAPHDVPGTHVVTERGVYPCESRDS
jgi:5-formyltetrahydrofolate cyclo-ligase